MQSRKLNEAAPEMISRHQNMVLYRASAPQQVARLPWFEGNPPNVMAQYLPVYIVIKDKAPYAAVSTSRGVARDASDRMLTPELAQEIAPLFGPVRGEFEQENANAPERGFGKLQQAVLSGAEGGEFGGEEEGEGGIGLVEPPEESPEEGVPASRLAMGAPKPQSRLAMGGDPLAGMRQMTGGDVDTVVSGARGEQDPARAKALRQQALSMMAQESKRRGESLAQCWLRHLLS